MREKRKNDADELTAAGRRVLIGVAASRKAGSPLEQMTHGEKRARTA